MGELLGVRAVARELGISHPAVIRAVKEGRLVPAQNENGRALYDIDVARQLWPSESVPAVDEEDAAAGDNSDLARYRKARADEKEAVAEQEKLELGRQRKELLPAEEIKAAWAQLLQAFSQSLSGLPQKAFSRFPGLTEAGRDFLIEELRQAMDDLSVWEVT